MLNRIIGIVWISPASSPLSKSLLVDVVKIVCRPAEIYVLFGSTTLFAARYALCVRTDA
jgi:hypothetical protein